VDCDWNDSAFNGHTVGEFVSGKDERTALEQLISWCGRDNWMCFWHFAQLRALFNSCKRLFGKKMLQCPRLCFYERICELAALKEVQPGSLWEMAAAYGIKSSAPEYCASSDVELLRRLLAVLGRPPEYYFSDKQKKKQAKKPHSIETKAEKMQKRREKNELFLQNAAYPDGSVSPA